MTGLLRVPLFDDELLVSFLGRTARVNGRNALPSFCMDLGMHFQGLLRGEERATRHASAVLGYPSDFLCDRRSIVVGRGAVEFRGEHFQRSTMRLAPIWFCPSCFLADDASQGRKPGVRRYRRVAWTLEALPVCVHHHCHLVSWSGHREGHEALDAHPLLQGASLSRQINPAQPTEFELFVASRIIDSGGVGMMGLMSDLPLPDCIELSYHLGMAATYGAAYSFRSVDEAALRRIRQRGFEVLMGGESGFRRLLDDLVSRLGTERAQRKYDLYGDIRRFLDSRPNAFHPLRRIVTSHASSRVPEVFPLRIPRSGTKGTISVSSIARETGVSADTVSVYLRLHRLVPEGKPISEMFEVDGDVGQATINALSSAIPELDACLLLGCRAVELRSLVISGILTPLIWSGSTTNLRRGDYYHSGQIAEFRPGMLDLTAPRNKGYPSIRTAAKRAGCEIGDVFNTIAEGRIACSGWVNSKSLLTALRIDVGKLRDALGLQGLIGAREVSKRLGLDQATLKIVAGNGLIGAELDDHGNPINFHLRDVRKFERRFISISTMARHLGENQRSVSKMCSKSAVLPAFPALKFKTKIFHRVDAVRLLAARGKELDGTPSGIGWARLIVGVARYLGSLIGYAERRSMPHRQAAGLLEMLENRAKRTHSLALYKILFTTQ